MSHRLIRAVLCAALSFGGCARARPPSAAEPQPAFPDLGGRAVMVLPLQGALPFVGAPSTADTTRPRMPLPSTVRAAIDAELAYWLVESSPRVQWILPERIERTVQNSPSINVRVRDLAVNDFLRSRVKSIGDPLFGDLHRLSIVFNAQLALLPFGAVWIPEQGGGGRVHIALALIDTFGAGVLWSGVAVGSPGAIDDAAVAASAAQAVTRLIPR